jgi:hypothetical protein
MAVDSHSRSVISHPRTVNAHPIAVDSHPRVVISQVGKLAGDVLDTMTSEEIERVIRHNLPMDAATASSLMRALMLRLSSVTSTPRSQVNTRIISLSNSKRSAIKALKPNKVGCSLCVCV